MASQNGMPSALIRSTVTLPEPRNGHLADDQAEPSGEANGQGNGEAGGDPKPRTPRKQRPKPPAGEKGKGRKLTIRDSVFARLELHAIKKGKTASAIVDELLDRELPHHRIATD
jgi:hypothetical protein